MGLRPVGRLFGALKHDGPPVTLEDVDRAIAEGGVRNDRVGHQRPVRYLVDDDAEQARAARTLLEEWTSEQPGFESLRRPFTVGRLCRPAD